MQASRERARARAEPSLQAPRPLKPVQRPLSQGQMVLATRSELEALERRLVKAEQTILRQDGQIKLLQARLDATAPAVDPLSLALRERSRSPRPFAAVAAPKSLLQPSAHGPDTTPTEFAIANGLDDKCVEALSSQPPEVQQHVISQGPVEGRNPSAMVMGRIAKATSELMALGAASMSAVATANLATRRDVQGGVEDFIANNGLDEKCADSLRAQTIDCQLAVIGQGPADGRNSSAMVMGRIAKYLRGDL
mmetsp:Transcript_118463/g.330458  ORF Transcript_118463/g.330458 Transcript_118463/m.330458 type:complete len:251 (+) Transcript_118463:24-776(+)